VRQPFAHHVPPPLSNLLNDARKLEWCLHSAAQEVLPASVLVRTDGLAVAVVVRARTSVEAVRLGRTLIDQVAQQACVEDLGVPLDASARPVGGRAR